MKTAKDETKTKRADASKLLWVEILEAKPNPLFTEDQRRSIRFLRYSKSIACAACKKKRRVMWTMICEFKAGDIEHSIMMLQNYQQVFAPLTPVCDDHPIGPAIPDAEGGVP